MTEARTRVAVVGAGFIAEFHLEILQRIPFVAVVAVVDRDRSRADRLAARFRVPQAFTDVAAMVKATQPEVAHVLVPPSVHRPVIEELLRLKVSVFAEKPLATTTQDCRDLVELANQNEVQLGVNHNNLFHPGYVRLKQWVKSQRIGNLQHVFACLHVPLRQLSAGDFSHWMFQDPRNIVLEQGPHPFSQIRDLLGEMVTVQTQPSGVRRLSPGLDFYDTWQISAQFQQCPATIVLSFGKDFAESWIHVIGQDGAAKVDLLRSHFLAWRKTPWMDFFDQFKNGFANARRSLAGAVRGAADYVLSTLKLKGRSDVFYVGMRDSITAFHEAFRDGRRLPASGADGLAIVDWCERIGKAVAPEEVARTEVARTEVAGTEVAGTEVAGTEVAIEPSGSSESSARTEQKHATPPAVLITGGTGFLGRYLVKRLRQDGHSMRVLVRSSRILPEHLRHADVEVVRGDMADAEVIDQAVQGVNAVYHLATGGGNDWPALRASMVGGCQTIAEACVRHGVSRLFFTSTIAACYLGDSNERPATEDDIPVDPYPEKRALYSRAKIACEKLLQDVALQSSLAVTIFRPAVVVGEGGPVQHSGVGLWTRDSQVFGWGMGKTPIPFVLVEDVADAMVRALSCPDSSGRVYNLVGDVGVSAREYVQALGQKTGRPFEFHAQPLFLFQTIELFKWLVKIIIRRPNVEFPSFRDLKSRGLTQPLDNRRAKQELGWTPVNDRAEFLSRALDWFAKSPYETNASPSSGCRQETDAAVAEAALSDPR